MERLRKPKPDFDYFIEERFSSHSAITHPFFAYLSELAKNDKLNASQFHFFRHIMFSRVYLTIPSIVEALKSAIIRRDKKSIITCYKNLSEELNSENNFYTHIDLMELAFNTVANEVYKLKPCSLLSCYNNPSLAEEIIYRFTVEKLYQHSPLVASLAQELSSGGLNTQQQPGMIASLYEVFLNIQQANTKKISNSLFINNVLPYFKAHLSIDKNFNINFDGHGVEYNHGERAKEDYLRSLSTNKQFEKDEPYFFAFFESQKILFDSALEKIKYII